MNGEFPRTGSPQRPRTSSRIFSVILLANIPLVKACSRTAALLFCFSSFRTQKPRSYGNHPPDR